MFRLVKPARLLESFTEIRNRKLNRISFCQLYLTSDSRLLFEGASSSSRLMLCLLMPFTGVLREESSSAEISSVERLRLGAGRGGNSVEGAPVKASYS